LKSEFAFLNLQHLQHKKKMPIELTQPTILNLKS
jgi:hypothetical protein